ncbi:PEP-CTERM sorting domain-containing protein [Phormidium sp. LEGE 05292]|uniref:exosortase-dependent surface protein XDP2 n=1 Tax=[Phormidium] sp. LEGE 05292 TaxID=767427 RepID=UPI00187E1AE0|nr:exosortase-dependent surface protein XDP2 [Phormidium sp. LEGE 05292]MBE9227309.1 PEP-CTERM sorting domain-containing protein [Phormidium sp. LEGE 05292]
MKLQNAATFLGLACSTVLAVSTAAQAANFTSNVSQTSDPEADIWLNSITQNGNTFNKFNLVNKAKILYNDPIKDVKPGQTSNPELGLSVNNTGAASTDRGDKASKPGGREVSGLNNPTDDDIAAYLGNNNLNNIIDVEDGKTMKMNLFFQETIVADNTGLDNLFFWERGSGQWNASDLLIQAIDASGNLIGKSLFLGRNDKQYAGFSLDTLEIDKAQEVGSWGVKLSQLGVTSAAGIRVFSDWTMNGPDFKVMARSSSKSVPEPATLTGLGLVAASLAAFRRRQVNKIS